MDLRLERGGERGLERSGRRESVPFDDLDECLVESEERKNYNTKSFGADVGGNEKSLDETSRNQSPSVNRQEDRE